MRGACYVIFHVMSLSMQPTSESHAINPTPSTTSNPSQPFILENSSKEIVSSGTYASPGPAQGVSGSGDQTTSVEEHVYAKVINKGSFGGSLQGVGGSLCVHS